MRLGHSKVISKWNERICLFYPYTSSWLKVDKSLVFLQFLYDERKTMFIFEIFIFSTQRIFSWIIALSWMFRTELLCFCFEWSWIVKENKQILAPIKCICSCTLTLSTNSLFVERREFVDWWKYMLLSSLMCILYVRLW